jgi:hypothetical protein
LGRIAVLTYGMWRNSLQQKFLLCFFPNFCFFS